MKKNLRDFIALFALAFVLLCSGCSKDETSVVESGSSDPYFSAKIDGRLWSTTSGILVSRQFEGGNAILMINANCNDGNFQLFFEASQLRIGTHTLHTMNWHDDTENGVGQFFINNGGGNYTTMFHRTGGTCTITTLTKAELAGTFEFYAQDGVLSGPVAHVTEGKFRVKLPQ